MNIWYLAHPVSGDEYYSYEQNLQHTLKIARILFDAGLNVVFPWWEMCHFADDRSPAHRGRGLEMDKELVRRLGRIILTGHRLSPGMEVELRAGEEAGVIVLDLLRVPDDSIPQAIGDWHHHVYEHVPA